MKGSAKIEGPLGPGQAHLGLGMAHLAKGSKIEVDLEFFTQFPGNEQALIETSFPQAAGMQWHRHDQPLLAFAW